MQIWILPLAQLTSENYEKMFHMCQKERQQKIKAMKNKNAQKQKAGAGYLLRCLQEYLILRKGKSREEVEIVTCPGGKPVFKNSSEIQFNISHSDALVVLAFGTQDIGVDAEIIRRVPKNVSERFFPELYQQYLEGLEEEKYRALFFQYWTQIEAWTKLTGKGLAAIRETKEILQPVKKWHVEKHRNQDIQFSDVINFQTSKNVANEKIKKTKFHRRCYGLQVLANDEIEKKVVITAVTTSAEKLPDQIIYRDRFVKDLPENLFFPLEAIIIKLKKNTKK